MVSSSANVELWLAAGLGGGLFWFAKGFRGYWESRLVSDTPECPIRTLAMGRVHVHGKAKGETQVTSPVTHSPCFFYKVVIEKWAADSRGGGHWAHYRTVTDGVPFYLEDATGRVLTHALGAEYDLIQSGRREIGSGSALVRLLGKEDDRLTQAMIMRTAPTDNELRAFVAGFPPLNRQMGMLFQTAGAVALESLTHEWTLTEASAASGRFRLTEYCILRDHWYDVTGACFENPNPHDANDRNLIGRGTDGSPFLISWRSEQGVEAELRHRAALHVFGGAALSIACLTLLLMSFGQL